MTTKAKLWSCTCEPDRVYTCPDCREDPMGALHRILGMLDQLDLPVSKVDALDALERLVDDLQAHIDDRGNR